MSRFEFQGLCLFAALFLEALTESTTGVNDESDWQQYVRSTFGNDDPRMLTMQTLCSALFTRRLHEP